MKTYAEINEKIKKGTAVVLTAEEVSELSKTLSPKEIAEKVDVVTTATFGAMCSSGAFLNFGHSNPPIRMEKIELNGIRVSGGLAAVDTYVGATDCNPSSPAYGGAHIIEDLVNGKDITLEAWGKGTDCYPRKHIKAIINKNCINEAILYNPRNCYQNYNVATNTSKAVNEHDIPTSNARTIAVVGDLKNMSTQYLRGAYIEKYGITLYVGIGIPIPILDEDLAKRVSIRNEQIETTVVDYGNGNQILGKTNYAALQSGAIEINGHKVRTAPLSSLAKAREIADLLKSWIQKGEFLLTEPVRPMPVQASLNGLKAIED